MVGASRRRALGARCVEDGPLRVFWCADARARAAPVSDFRRPGRAPHATAHLGVARAWRRRVVEGGGKKGRQNLQTRESGREAELPGAPC